MTTPDTVLTDLESAGVRLWPEGGKVHYRAPGPLTPAHTSAIVASKAALLPLLAEWDAPAALRLMGLADAEVERCGRCGADEAIRRLAGEFDAAYRAGDMAGVRRCCALVEERARRVAAQSQRSVA